MKLYPSLINTAYLCFRSIQGRLSGSTIKEERIRFYGTSSKIATKIQRASVSGNHFALPGSTIKSKSCVSSWESHFSKRPDSLALQLMGKNPGELTGYAETVDFHEEPTLATSHQTDKEETDTSPAKPGSELRTASISSSPTFLGSDLPRLSLRWGVGQISFRRLALLMIQESCWGKFPTRMC